MHFNAEQFEEFIFNATKLEVVCYYKVDNYIRLILIEQPDKIRFYIDVENKKFETTSSKVKQLKNTLVIDKNTSLICSSCLLKNSLNQDINDEIINESLEKSVLSDVLVSNIRGSFCKISQCNRINQLITSNNIKFITEYNNTMIIENSDGSYFVYCAYEYVSTAKKSVIKINLDLLYSNILELPEIIERLYSEYDNAIRLLIKKNIRQISLDIKDSFIQSMNIDALNISELLETEAYIYEILVNIKTYVALKKKN